MTGPNVPVMGCSGAARDVAARLLLGPRGRRLCLEYAVHSSPAVGSALFPLARHLDVNPGARYSLTGRAPAPADDPIPTAEELVACLRTVDLSTVDPEGATEALRASLNSARYWQEPDGNDEVAALPEVRAALHPLAELIAAALPDLASRRGTKQWAVDWNSAENAAPLPTDPAAALRMWTRELADEEQRATRDRPLDPHARWSGTWWSVPQTILETRGTVEAALELVEDSFGWTAATFIPVSGFGSVLEIESADDWARLCRDYPVEVTASRRHDWFRTTGRNGRWVIPHWERVAQDWDAVHLTALGYYSSATQLVRVDAEFASVIAGWAPDSTLWLRDVAREATAARQEWSRPTDQDEWARITDA
ncbi:hypothetical protein [Pseudoclavibacter sp. VKM Ac-2867]|uniref:hypothetical protein n=1 Tax=Pseudoclavibacter sp. VKM Ac-2867 TaxID=2783829 RepID=UPI00188B148D|nr:hypothetical protein [Pseudoclavibacter sp. VKM Ac-2867]MBF4459578.1 hypothetical protein [Pseudoclavibacter sp. VKM Ac-2867]